ncbi:hypothetical protein Gotur_011922 [Gossypium turneri]
MIPRSICKLKNLRYLNLSRNFSNKNLPKSICKIQNLQVLKLDLYWELEELPKKIESLVNLTHLACGDCYSLTHMPRGIGKLTSLETLSMFVVDKDGSHDGADLSELSGLNNLRGQLEIRYLGFIKNVKEKFKAANLKEKQHLRLLVLAWNYGDDNDDGNDDDDDDKSLEDLRPHPNLKGLFIRGWRGDTKFPSSRLAVQTRLKQSAAVSNTNRIWGPSNFKQIPSFAQLPCLQKLSIADLTVLECTDDNSPKGSKGEPESFFSSLKSLCLKNCPNMKSWWRKRSIDDDNEDDTTVIGTSTMSFPCLSSLEIANCPLTSMPLYPLLNDDLRLVKTSSRPLKQTMKMNITDEYLKHFTGLKKLTIGDSKEVDLEGMQWQALKNLSHLEIIDIPRLVSLPLGLQHPVQLKRLEIRNCNGLRSLFPVFQHLTFFEVLVVMNCEELELSAAGFQIFQDHTRLRSLALENIPKCRHLPEWIQHLTNL